MQGNITALYNITVFAIFLVLQIIGLPKTPRWLVQHNRYEEARSVTAALEDKPLDNTETNNMINYYAPVIFQDSMLLSRNLSLILGGAAQCTYLVGSAIPVLLMDRFGRRTLLLSCTVGLCLCFVMVTILLSIASAERQGPAYGATAFIFLFQLVYGVGWLPVPWFYPSEVATTRTRTKMQAIASGFNWLFVFAVVKITPIAFANIGWRTFIIFAVLNAAFIPMVYCFYPETQGITLEDIPLLFHKGGVTGGVLTSKGGRTVVPHQHATEAHVDEKMGERREDSVGGETMTTV
ncbi:MFS general substrate transporter [Byssothecium circinans]|uniref:MFS general substrate transporter n=1 Tax=Byssothecium circinans TaxID=147558 RepID=A0A6A5THB0_9PLEO|nr:MFS general substrate transporter [Byssothecium circinans]